MKVPHRLARHRALAALWAAALLGILPARQAAGEELALWSAPAPGPSYCDAEGRTQPMAPLLFALPGAAPPAAGDGCDGKMPRALPRAAALQALAALAGRREEAQPEQGGQTDRGGPYLALYADGHLAPVEVLGALAARDGGMGARLLARPACPEPCRGGCAGPAEAPGGPAPPPDGGPPLDAARPDGGLPCPEVDQPALALLLRAPEPAAPRQTILASLSGVVRRRIGRQSLPARGRLVGTGPSVAAIFKRRGDAVQLAIFGEDGGLRLYQTVPWRRGKRVVAKPTALYLVPGLGGPGQDGLLLMGEGEGGPVYLLLAFSGRALRVYP